MASAFSATRWVIASSFGSRILALGGQVAILRLVEKEVFGGYRGLVDIHLMLLALFPFALDSLLIREKNRRNRFAAALSMVLAMMGAFFAAMVILLLVAPAGNGQSVAASIVSDHVTWKAIALMAPIFIVMCAKLSIRALLAADLDFKNISIGEFGNSIITFFGGALAVIFYPSAASLMAAYLLGELFECCWLFYKRHPRPMAFLKLRHWSILGKITRKNWKFLTTNSADLTINNVGSLIPGPLIMTLISADANADFTASRLLIQLPILLLAGAIWRVAYPAISGVSEELLQSRCLAITGTTSAFLVPGVLWLAFYAPSTAYILGGEKYVGAAVLVVWMAPYMALTGIFSPISALDMIRDKSEWGLAWNIVHTVTRIGLIITFASAGLVTTIAVISTASFVLWIVWAVMLGILLRCGLGKFFWTTFRFAPAWAVLAAAMYSMKLLPIPMLIPPFLGGIFLLVYTAYILKFYPVEANMFYRIIGRNPKTTEATTPG